MDIFYISNTDITTVADTYNSICHRKQLEVI